MGCLVFVQPENGWGHVDWGWLQGGALILAMRRTEPLRPWTNAWAIPDVPLRPKLNHLVSADTVLNST